MGYILGEPTVQQYFDANGDPLENGTIEFYVWNTSTPTAIYSDSTGTSAGTSVTLNSIGAPANGGTSIALFFDTNMVYKIVRKDSFGTAISPTIGPYYGSGGGGFFIDAVDSGASDSLYDYTGTFDGQQSQVGGYYTVGDGGGGIFYWDASSSAADNGGSVILPTGHTGNGRWLRIIENSISVKMFGAVGDGVTDDGAAIQSAISLQNSIVFPAGTYLVNSTILVQSNTMLSGDGTGVSIIKVGSSLALGVALLRNNDYPIAGARQNSNITICNLTFNGIGRVYPSYPTAGFDTLGSIIKLDGVNGANIYNIEIKNHQANAGIVDGGCRNLRIRDSIFHNCGKDDWIASPIWSAQYGSLRKIVGISKANPAVVSMTQVLSPLTNGSTISIRDVQGMESVPDGEYVIDNIIGSTFELVGVNTTGDTGFIIDMMAYVGFVGGAGNLLVPSEDITINGCHFYNNLRSGITFAPVNGGSITNCTFYDNGEASIYLPSARRIVITGNTIRKTTLTDIVAEAIEANNSASVVITDNLFEDTATTAIQLAGCMGVNVSDNVFRNIIRDNTIVYPNRPFAVAAGIVGDPLGDSKTSCIFLSSIYGAPCSNININNNTIVDTRLSPQANSCVVIGKQATNNDTYQISIKNNDFSASGVVAADMIRCIADAIVLPHLINISENMGQASEFPVTRQSTISATGVIDYNVGFVPSSITIQASDTVSGARMSFTTIVRSKTAASPGTLGFGHRFAVDATTESAAKISSDAWRVADAAGTSVSAAEFSAWLCEQTRGIGVAINVGVATNPADVTLTFYP